MVFDAAGNLYGTTGYGGGVSNTYCVNRLRQCVQVDAQVRWELDGNRAAQLQ